MNMIVCVKQVIDPEAPPASFKIDPASSKVMPRCLAIAPPSPLAQRLIASLLCLALRLP